MTFDSHQSALLSLALASINQASNKKTEQSAPRQKRSQRLPEINLVQELQV
jgi:hypothetical protein